MFVCLIFFAVEEESSGDVQNNFVERKHQFPGSVILLVFLDTHLVFRLLSFSSGSICYL